MSNYFGHRTRAPVAVGKGSEEYMQIRDVSSVCLTTTIWIKCRLIVDGEDTRADCDDPVGRAKRSKSVAKNIGKHVKEGFFEGDLI
jgi:hypothetical protein